MRCKKIFARFFLIFYLLFTANNLFSQSTTQLLESIGTQGIEYGNSIVRTNDAGFAITGSTACLSCPSDVYVIKIDSNYNLNWSLIIGGNNVDSGNSIIQTTDGGFAVIGYTSSYTGGAYLLKLNSSGSLLWSETIGILNGYSIVQTSDKGFAIGGYTALCPSCRRNMCIVKLDSTGALSWAETIGGTAKDTAYSLIETTDKGFVLAGTSTSFGAGGTDIYIVKLDSAGNLKWTRTIGGTGNESAYSIKQTLDKGYGIAGITNSFGAGGYDMYVIKLDSAGNLKWTITMGSVNNEIAKSVITTSDSSLIIAGSTISGSNEKVCVAKLSSTGALDWYHIISGDSSCINSITQVRSGEYAAIGATSYFGSGLSDVYFLLLDTLGKTCVINNLGGGITSVDSGRINSGGTVNSFTPTINTDASSTSSGGATTLYCSSTPTSVSQVSDNVNAVNIFPNPTKDKTYLHFNLIFNSFINISVTDLAGKTIYSCMLAPQKNENYELPVSSLASGIYFVRIINNDKVFYTKLIKE